MSIMAPVWGFIELFGSVGQQVLDFMRMMLTLLWQAVLPPFYAVLSRFEGPMLTRVRDLFNFYMPHEGVLLVVGVGMGGVFLQVLLRHSSFFLPSRQGLRLPPGSMGWPYFGETLSLRSEQQKFYLKRNKMWVVQPQKLLHNILHALLVVLGRKWIIFNTNKMRGIKWPQGLQLSNSYLRKSFIIIAKG